MFHVCFLHEAVQTVADVEQRFGVAADACWVKQCGEILDDCVTVLCTGLLFYALKSSKDKVGLRDAVTKALALLKSRGLSMERLPKALHARAELALAFKLAIATT